MKYLLINQQKRSIIFNSKRELIEYAILKCNSPLLDMNDEYSFIFSRSEWNNRERAIQSISKKFTAHDIARILKADLH